MKEQLFDLYSKRHHDFRWIREQYPDEDMAGPFLMSPKSNFSLQPNPLLIIGQETGGWHYHIDDLKEQMAEYERFNVGWDYHSSPFWNVTRKVESALGNESFSCAWTNLSKYDHNDGHATGEYEAAISSVDDVLSEEVRIVNPKVCLFFTGPTMDTRISKIFKQLTYQAVPGFETRELAQLIHQDLPLWTFRSYHPKFLRLQGKEENFLNFISALGKNLPIIDQ